MTIDFRNAKFQILKQSKGYEVSELICLKCLNRAIHVYYTDTPLKDLECKCGCEGYLINTGQTVS